MNTADEFILALKAAGFTDELMQEITNSKNNRMARKMLNVIKYDLDASKMILNFTVDYFSDLSKDIVDNDGVHRFLPKDDAKNPKNIITEVFHFEDNEDSERKMAEDGYRPANAYELVAFGKNNPKPLRPFPIVALSSTWHDDMGDKVLFLRENDADDEHEYCYFVLPQWPMTLPEGYCLLGVKIT